MCGFIKRMGTALLAVTLLAANAGPVEPAALIDGKPSSGVPVMHGDGGKLMVAVQPLAERLGIPVKHQSGSLALQVDGTWVQLRADDITLHEGDSPVVRLTSFPTVRHGRLFINAADVSTVLDVDANVRGGHLEVLKRQSKVTNTDDNLKVSYVAVPKPTTHATQPPESAQDSHGRLLGNFSASMSDYAQQRNYTALLDGGGDHFHAMMYVNGMQGSRATLGGTLRLGDIARKHASLGGINNPLYGTVFAGGGSNGLEGVNEHGTFASYSVTTVDARRVLAIGHRSGDWVSEVALASQFGVFQPMIGLQRWHETPHYVFDRELWLGEHGIGAGIQYRTTGRLYADTRIAFAGGGLPLVTGDALTQATIGYDIRPSVGLRAGYGIAHAQGGQALFQLYGGNASTSFTLSHFGIQNSATVDFVRQSNKMRFGYIKAPGYGAYENDGSFELPHGSVETRAYFASGSSTDVLADYHFKRESPSLTLGIESVRASNGGRVAPTIGYLFPVGSTLSAGFEFHPLANGNGIRFTVQQAVYGNATRPRRSIFIDMQSPLTSPVYLLVDGVKTQQITEQHSRVAIDSGSHYVSVQSTDHRFGSPEQRVLDGVPTTVMLPLWPLVDVRGVVRVQQMPPGMTKPTLGGITVTLKPQGVTTQTEADGSFSFPSAAIDPTSTVVLDPDSIPHGLAAPDPLPAQSKDLLVLSLHPSQKIEKVVF